MKRYQEFAEYFNELLSRKEPKVLQEEVARKLGITQGALSKIKNGMLVPSDELAERISSVWGVLDFMEKVSEARRNDGARLFRDIEKKKESEQVVKVGTKPRIPVSAASGRLSMYSKGLLLDECEQMPIIRNLPDYDYTMFISGNSMEPKYVGGDEIAIKRSGHVIEWGKDYVLDTDDGLIFKKVYEEGDKIRCVSYNHEEYPDFLVPKDIIYGFYRFVGLVRV